MAARYDYPNEEWSSLFIDNKWMKLEVGYVDKKSPSHLDICISEGQDDRTVYIDQEEIKELIAHLQKQLIA